MAALFESEVFFGQQPMEATSKQDSLPLAPLPHLNRNSFPHGFRAATPKGIPKQGKAWEAVQLGVSGGDCDAASGGRFSRLPWFHDGLERGLCRKSGIVPKLPVAVQQMGWEGRKRSLTMLQQARRNENKF
eukprot:EG_transcript_31439